MYSPDGRFLLSASEDYTIREWEKETGICRLIFKGHDSYVRSATYSPDGQLILSASKDKTIREWDRETGKLLRSYEGHGSSVRCAVYSADGKYILSASGDKTIREWDRTTASCLRVIRGHDSAVTCAAYSSDGRYIFSASKDKTVRKWDNQTGKCIFIINHNSAVRSVICSADGRYILSISRNNTVSEWDSETGVCLCIFEGKSSGNSTITEKSFDDLMEPFHQAVRSENYENAFDILPELEKADYERYGILYNELEFLFDRTISLEDNKKYWTKYKDAIKDKIALWSFLKYDYAEVIVDEMPMNENEDEQSKEESEASAKETDDPQKIGEDLEVSVADILNELFRIDGSELLELRKQLAGNQNGFDVKFKYRDEFGLECNCRIECKAGNQVITSPMVSGKLDELRRTKIAENETIHHWILISPKGRIANDLPDALVIWENENRWDPIQKVQVWSRDCFVEEFFGIIPEVFKKYYPANKKIAPDKWSADERKNKINEWKKKIKPSIPLPKAWKDYFSNHAYLLTHTEHDLKKYDALYNCHSSLPCLDEAGNLVDKSAEDYIVQWAKRKDNKNQALLILGEYGDGKTFLTYSVSRRLAEDYKASPGTSVIPLRLVMYKRREI